MNLVTDRLQLQLQTPSEMLNWVETLPAEIKKELSADWLLRLSQSTAPDPWTCMYRIVQKSDCQPIGMCGFKGSPDANGMVEIAYGIDDEYQHQGFATESAQALVAFASTIDSVKTVRANTSGSNPASDKVLEKLNFQYCGQFEEPDDGLVNRWEIKVK